MSEFGVPGVSPGLMSRVVSGLRYAVTGVAPADWFGPSAPVAPAAPQVAGRQFDYPVGFNLRTQPREDAFVSFAELRALAERWDLLRLVIETRKDQMASLDWTIQPKRLRAGGAALASPDDPRIAWLQRFLADPDREHGWAGWLRMLLEDLFVIDAPTLHVRRDMSGALVALEVVDGATIKRVLNADGRTPIAPDPAYQQVLKGVAAVDYTADELIYAPRNPRPHRVYGFSPVEQIVMSANVALRRQVSQLNYFTEGNTPEALIGVPDDWTPDQIRQFQEYWDALLQGNLAARRHTRFVPGGLKYQPTRDAPLKDDFDEWLARIVCFAFSIPPTAFSSQVNRATAETAQQAALAEGLAPLQNWLKGLIDRILARVLGWDDLEFAWAAGSAVDPLMQAQIDTAYVAAGIKTADEVRAALGLGALPSRAVAKFNPNHDARGRFASGDGAGSSSQSLMQLASMDTSDPEDPENEFEEEQEKMRQRMPSILNLSGQNRGEIPGQHEFSPMGIAGGALGNSGAKEPGATPNTRMPSSDASGVGGNAPGTATTGRITLRPDTQHLFRNDAGHLPDTPENRQLLEDVANDPSAILGPDKHGAIWSQRTLPDGKQLWTKTINGKIDNAGLNQSPKNYNSSTGLSSPTRPPKRRN
jgi:hypothetical protein